MASTRRKIHYTQLLRNDRYLREAPSWANFGISHYGGHHWRSEAMQLFVSRTVNRALWVSPLQLSRISSGAPDPCPRLCSSYGAAVGRWRPLSPLTGSASWGTGFLFSAWRSSQMPVFQKREWRLQTILPHLIILRGSEGRLQQMIRLVMSVYGKQFAC